MSNLLWRKTGLLVGALSALGLLTAVACGGGEPAPTPTQSVPTATSTAVPPTATATPSGAVPTTVVAAPTSTAVPTPTPVPTVQPKRGGIIKANATEDPPNFDPQQATSSGFNIYNQKLYTGLMWNPQGNLIVLDGAESYSISADGKVWTFKLRPDIKFQTGYTPAHPRDGTTMTSQDVKYSLEKMMGTNGQPISPRCGWMKEFINIDRTDNGVEVVDNLTVNIHLNQPFPALANILVVGHCGIMPDGVTTDMMAKRPYGSGPFRVKDFQRGAIWRLARNQDYFKPGLPYLDEYHYLIMDGTAIAQAAFLTNKTDITGGYPTPDNTSIYAQRVAAGEFYMVPIRSDCRPQSINMNSTKPPFNDKRLRQAVNLAIDRQAYAQVVHENHVTPSLYLDTDKWGKTLDEILKLPGYRQPHDADFAEAKKIANELYPKGLDLKMMVRNTSTYMRQGEFLAGELKKIGLNVTIEALDTNIVFDRAAKLDYTLWSYYFCQTSNTPDELFGSYFITGGSRNWYGFSDPQIDKMYLDMAATTDPVEKKKKAMAMEDIVYSFLPGAPLPDALSSRNAKRYVQNLPVTITQYSREKSELVWRSDI